MSDYRYLLTDSSAGTPICEVPLSVESFSYAMNDAGQLTATLPLDDPNATESNFSGDREVTVLRDDVAVWNGPIVEADALRSSGVVQVTAREASWHLLARVLEVDKTYASGTDVATILADLNTYAQGKKSNGTDGMTLGADIVATLPRWSLSCTTGTVTTQQYKFFGSARHTVGEIIDLLQPDPTTGFEWRMDFATGSTRQSVQRTFTVGVPSLGVTQTELLTEHVLADYGRNFNFSDATSRVHVVGSGYTKTLQNSGAVSAGRLLSEQVVGLTDTSDHGVVDSRAKEERRRRQPPVRTYSASFTPGSALPFGWLDVGDTVTLAITTPALLAISATRRVVEITVVPPREGEPERVDLTFNQPLTDTGA